MRSKEVIEEAVKESKTYSDVCRNLGLTTCGGNIRSVKRAIIKYNIDISHFVKSWNRGIRYEATPIRTIEELLVNDSDIDSSSLKKRLLKAGYKEYKCERCGLTEWEGEDIPLELHHINGDHFDNRLENLIVLCPNCHSLVHKTNKHKDYKPKEKKSIILNETEYEEHKKKLNKAYRDKKRGDNPIREKKERKLYKRICPVCGKEFETKYETQNYCSHDCYNKAKSVRPSKEQLLKDIEELGMNQTAIGKKYNVLGNAVKKWLKRYDLYERNVYINKLKKRVLQYDLDMNLINEFESLAEAERITQIKVSNALIGLHKTAGGYIWKYAE